MDKLLDWYLKKRYMNKDDESVLNAFSNYVIKCNPDYEYSKKYLDKQIEEFLRSSREFNRKKLMLKEIDAIVKETILSDYKRLVLDDSVILENGGRIKLKRRFSIWDLKSNYKHELEIHLKNSTYVFGFTKLKNLKQQMGKF